MLALEPLERYEAALEDARAVLRQDPRNEMANKGDDNELIDLHTCAIASLDSQVLRTIANILP